LLWEGSLWSEEAKSNFQIESLVTRSSLLVPHGHVVSQSREKSYSTNEGKEASLANMIVTAESLLRLESLWLLEKDSIAPDY
jgi:hypothetical protein